MKGLREETSLNISKENATEFSRDTQSWQCYHFWHKFETKLDIVISDINLI